MIRLVAFASLLAGCTLYSSRNDGPSGDDDGPGPGSGSGSGSSPVGRSILVNRTLVSGEPCGFFQESQAISVDVVSTTNVIVEGTDASAVIVRPSAAREDRSDPPNVSFHNTEVWDGELGLANPLIQQQLWVDGTTITGHAMTSFQHNSGQVSTFCSYTWQLSGL